MKMKARAAALLAVPFTPEPSSMRWPRLACGAVVMAAAGCATQRIDAQWSDAQLAASAPLRGATVFVVCEAREVVLSRLCTDRLNTELQARGARGVSAGDDAATAPGQPRDDARYVSLARAAGATAVWAASVAPDLGAADGRGSSSVSLGLGGFSIGRGGGVGIGVGVPIGGGGSNPAPYAADSRVMDVASGRLVWTARAGSPNGNDTSGQIDDLMQRLVGAAAEAKLF